jgi:predicted alpha-1,6-mannanase (GH76 family)
LGAAQIVETAGGDDGLLAGILAHHLARLVAPSGV